MSRPPPAGRAAAPLCLLLCLVPGASGAQAPAAPPFLADPVLEELVSEALAKRPELAGARAAIRAEQERLPGAGALPDPVLSLSLQNDGFTAIRIGEMETSYVSIMASQTFPWFGKRGLRTGVAELDAKDAEAELERALLSVRAELEQAYLELLLVRDRLAVQERLETLWGLAEGLARTRYETGEGAQSDILRAQLERSRLKQRRWALKAEETRKLAILNRLRGQPPEQSLATTRSLEELPDPELPELEAALREAASRSPELKRARLLSEQSGARSELARREYYPDLTVSAGVMPRGGLEPMWQAGVAFSLPVWGEKGAAVLESQARETVASSGEETVRHLLRQRVYERHELLSALLETNRLYRSGLLVQSGATVQSTLAQFRVGQVSFASVLEALSGHLADLEGFLDSVAAAQALAIAEREASLSLVSAPAAGGGGSARVPGSGGMGGGAGGGGGGGGAAPAAAEGGSSSMKRM